jgi:hypothetical protein
MAHRIIAAFIKTENPANIKYNIYELLTHKERLEAESTLEPNETVISRRLLNGSIEPYGNQFVIKSKAVSISDSYTTPHSKDQ